MQTLKKKEDLPDGSWTGILMAVMLGMHATIHMTDWASPTQLVFGQDHFLNVNFKANWQLQAIDDTSKQLLQECNHANPPIHIM